MEPGKEWLSVQEAADCLGVARTTIYRWAKESKLRIYKLAKGVARVKRQDLEAFLQARCCTQIRGSSYTASFLRFARQV